DFHTIGVFAQGFDGGGKPRFGVDLPEDQAREIAARNAEEAAVQGEPEKIAVEAGAALAILVHEPDMLYETARFQCGGQQSHAFDQIVANAPDVDHVAAVTE